MILSMDSISVWFGAKQVLNDISFSLNAEEHVGVVGANGVGKSTLLKVIMSVVEPDKGRFTTSPSLEIGYLAQELAGLNNKTVEDFFYEYQGNLRQIEEQLRALEQRMSAISHEKLDDLLITYGQLQERFERKGGYELDYKVDLVLEGLGLSYLQRNRKIASLSGGEKSRVSLAALLLQAPELMLLDEPTNHLDFQTLEWLENYLSTNKSAFLVISHDREFLNKLVNKILEIDDHTHELKEYFGNYDEYLNTKKKERVLFQEAYERQQEELAVLRQAIKSRSRQVGHNKNASDNDKITHNFFGERVQQTVSRNIRAAEEKLRRLEGNLLPKPPELLRISPDFAPEELEGSNIITVSNISKSYEGRIVLQNINFSIGKNDRVTLVGTNGTGKTTLLKILAGTIKPDTGQVTLASTVKIGYLDQEQETLQPDQNVFDAYREGITGYEDELKSDLFRYALFTYEETLRQVKSLSVGEKRKLQIARLIAMRANLLLLDEPTNHVSFNILEDFEQALLKFPGPIIAVSHDRRFIQHFSAQLWELRNGTITIHQDYSSYLKTMAK